MNNQNDKIDLKELVRSMIWVQAQRTQRGHEVNPTITEPRQLTAMEPTLTLNDRCDACGARAYYKAEFAYLVYETGNDVPFVKPGELLLCGHHAKKHEAKLSEISTRITDERWSIH